MTVNCYQSDCICIFLVYNKVTVVCYINGKEKSDNCSLSMENELFHERKEGNYN